jgi:hypothetical protein
LSREHWPHGVDCVDSRHPPRVDRRQPSLGLPHGIHAAAPGWLVQDARHVEEQVDLLVLGFDVLGHRPQGLIVRHVAGEAR